MEGLDEINTLKEQVQSLQEKLDQKKIKQREAALKYYHKMKNSEEYKEKGKERRRIRYENNKEESWGRMKRWIEEHPERVKELHKEQARKYREKLENDPELKQLHLEKAKIARLKHKNKMMLNTDNIKKQLENKTV